MAEPVVTLHGNITRDPQLKFLDSGAKQLSFGLAVNHSYKPKGSDTWVKRTSFYDIVMYADRSMIVDNVASSLAKGHYITVDGTQSIRTFTRDDGSEGTAVQIRATEVSASLRFATVTIHTNPKVENSGGSSEPAYGYDEEPF